MTTQNVRTVDQITRTRRTADGKRVCFWSFGETTVEVDRLTERLIARSLPVEVVGIVADEVCVWNADELPALIRGARRACLAMADLRARDARMGSDSRRLRDYVRIYAARAALKGGAK